MRTRFLGEKNESNKNKDDKKDSQTEYIYCSEIWALPKRHKTRINYSMKSLGIENKSKNDKLRNEPQRNNRRLNPSTIEQQNSN